MNKSAEEKIHSYIGWEKESAYEPWQFIGLLPLFDPLQHDITENKAGDGRSNQKVDRSAGMFLNCRYEIVKWRHTSTVYQ